MLFKNELLLLQFRFKPKILTRELVTSDSSKICPKICPFKNRFKNHYRNTKEWENYAVGNFNAISFDKHRKTSEANESNAVESNHSDESDIIRIYITFLEKTFFGQSILTLYEAFKVVVFTVMLLLRRNTSVRYA